MRILIANDQHWPMKSGPATACRTLAQGLAKLGHEVLVVAPSQTGRGYDEVDDNYTIHRLRSFGLAFRKNLRISVTYERELRRILREFEPDIVHIYTQLPIGIGMLQAALHADIPVVATNHLMPDNLIKNVKLLMPVARQVSYLMTEYSLLIFKGARRLIMPTESAFEIFNLERIDMPLVAISNGINLDRFRPTAAKPATYTKFGIPTDKTVIGYLARLDREKHIDVVLSAFAVLRRQGYDIKLLVVGAGNADAELRRLAYGLEIEDDVIFTGLVSDEDMVELHKVPAIYAMPSPTELQCISLLESMASGKPAVAVDAGALGELCRNDENGYLVAVDDHRGFARAFQMLLDNPARLKKFGKASRLIAESHDEKVIMPQFVQLYEDVIAETASQPLPPPRASHSASGVRRFR